MLGNNDAANIAFAKAWLNNHQSAYLPIEKKLWANEKMITDAEDCWKGLQKRWAGEDKQKKPKKE